MKVSSFFSVILVVGILGYTVGSLIAYNVKYNHIIREQEAHIRGLESVIEHNLTKPRGWNTQFYLDLAKVMGKKYREEGR